MVDHRAVVEGDAVPFRREPPSRVPFGADRRLPCTAGTGCGGRGGRKRDGLHCVGTKPESQDEIRADGQQKRPVAPVERGVAGRGDGQAHVVVRRGGFREFDVFRESLRVDAPVAWQSGVFPQVRDAILVRVGLVRKEGRGNERVEVGGAGGKPGEFVGVGQAVAVGVGADRVGLREKLVEVGQGDVTSAPRRPEVLRAELRHLRRMGGGAEGETRKDAWHGADSSGTGHRLRRGRNGAETGKTLSPPILSKNPAKGT